MLGISYFIRVSYHLFLLQKSSITLKSIGRLILKEAKQWVCKIKYNLNLSIYFCFLNLFLGSGLTDCYRQWKTLEQHSETIGDVIGFSKEQKQCMFYEKPNAAEGCTHFLKSDAEWTTAAISKPTKQNKFNQILHIFVHIFAIDSTFKPLPCFDVCTSGYPLILGRYFFRRFNLNALEAASNCSQDSYMAVER